MKKTMVLALVSVAAIGVQAGVITNVGSSPSANSDILLGAESADTAQQTVKYVADGSEALLGQTFTLASIGATEDYKVTDLYLKAATAEDWDLTTGNLEIKILQGTGGAVLGTYSYAVDTVGNGVGSDHVANDWLKFSLDAGLVLADGGVYSFQSFWSATDDDNNWGFRRDNDALDIYADGGGYYATAALYDAADWNTSNPWNGMVARPVTQDQMFYVAGSVIPEPATLGLVAMIGTGLLFVRRRLIL